MPTHTTVTLPAGQWTLLAASAAGDVSIYPREVPIYLAGAVGAVVPLTSDGAAFLSPFVEPIIGQTLLKLFPGVAATHLYGYSEHKTSVAISAA